MIEQTSIMAFENIKETLGHRQQEVYKILQMFQEQYNGSLSNTEIATLLRRPINTITPRINELRKKNKVTYNISRLCTITGQMVKTWKTKQETQ